MLVQQGLSAATIEIADSAENATSVIRQLAERMAGILGVDRGRIEQAVLERERARTTAFTNGAAVPHCRLPGLKQFVIGLMILRQPVRWDNEGHAVDTIMMIVGPAENVSDHLRVLANSSQLLDSTALRAKLKRVPDAAAARTLLAAAEEAVELRRTQDGMLRELRREQKPVPAQDYLAEVVNRFEW